MRLMLDTCRKCKVQTKLQLVMLILVFLILGGMMPIHAQEKCEIYYLPISAKLDFDSLKHISMHEFINGEFHYLTVTRNVQYFAPLPPESLSAPELQADKQILSLADDVQDIYWLYNIASLTDMKNFFSGRDSDFAPYILRALKRQNLDDMAQQFAVAMEAFGNRYQGFDASKNSIESFPIPVSEAELDEIFLKMMAAYDTSAEGAKYKEAVLKQRELTKKLDGDKISYQRRNMMEYNLFYQQHPQTLAAQKLLDGFPNQNEIYKAIHDKICNNPNLKNWYLTTYNAQTDRAHLWFIQHKLITRKNDLGPRESWPIYYQNIFSLYLFQIEIRNGGISQYFDNSSSEDLPNLLKALKSSNLDDIIPIVLEAKSLHDKFEQLKQKYNLSDPQDFIKVDELLRQPLAEFESKIDVDELDDKIDIAMLKLAKENNILPQ